MREGAEGERPWTGKSHGGYAGHLCFAFIVRRMGLRPAYALLALVAAYFMAFKRGVYRESARYLARAANPPRLLMPVFVYRHVFSFGRTLIDKWAYLSGCGDVRIINACRGEAERLMEGGRGLVVLSAHFGAWECASQILEGEYGRKVRILGMRREHADIEGLLEKNRKMAAPVMIDQSEGGASAIEAFAALKSGAIVAMQGDRYAGGRHIRAEFLGKPAKFPTAAYSLASAAEVAVLQTLCVRVAHKTYEVRAAGSFLPGRGKPPKQPDECARAFAANLERQARKTPFMWFNFYDFWAE